MDDVPDTHSGHFLLFFSPDRLFSPEMDEATPKDAIHFFPYNSIGCPSIGVNRFKKIMVRVVEFSSQKHRLIAFRFY